MNENLAAILQDLPENLSSHLQLTVLSLAVGIAVSVPLAVFVSRRERVRGPVMAVASIIQTVPSLALLALMVPVLAWIGGPAFGFVPAVIALTLYSVLPILRNTVTGILGVEPSLTEAARGVGMSPHQSLVQVELPLAAPVIIAGIRTATVWTAGMATLATPVGQRCLGNFIFAGLQTNNWMMVVVGVIAAATLAIVLDSLIGVIERGVADRRPALVKGAFAGLLVAVSLGIIGPRFGVTEATVATGESKRHGGCELEHISPLRIGTKSFSEQYILAEMFRAELERAGIQVELVESLGSTVVFEALTRGEIGAYVDYSGTIWVTHMKEERTPPPWHVTAEVNGWLASEHQVRNLGTLGFENAYALAMKRSRAEELGVSTVADLAKVAGNLKMAADYEFFKRPEWSSLKETYGLNFAKRDTFDPNLMVQALLRDEADVIPAYTSDGRIAANDLKLIRDPLGAIPPYDAMLLLSPQVASCAELVDALAPFVGAIPLDAMQKANLMVDREQDKTSPAQAAEWLRQQLNRPRTP